MKEYIITESAGRKVAGQTNTGAGTRIRLTPSQAEHELRLGTLKEVPVEGEVPAAVEVELPPAPAPAPAAPAKGKSKKR